MKKYFTAFCLLFTISLVFGQVAKQKVGFVPYTDPANHPYRKDAYSGIYEMATRIFINTQRFEVLDREKFNIVKLEKEFTKGEDFINSQIVKQGNALAADVIAVAKITTMDVTQAPDGGGWSAYIAVECKQIDVETVKALNAYRLEGNFKDLPIVPVLNTPNPDRAKSPGEAVGLALKKMEKGLEKWISTNFPITMKIAETRPDERTLIAKGGRNIGLTEKHKMRVVRITRLDGELLVETIAKVSLFDAIGEGLTKFRATKADWDKVERAIEAAPNNIFITEDTR